MTPKTPPKTEVRPLSELDSITPDALVDRVSMLGSPAKPLIPKRKKRIVKRIVIKKPQPKTQPPKDPPPIAPLTNLAEIPEGWNESYMEKLSARQRDLARFLFIEITTLESAIPVAMEDALDCVRMATGAENVSFSLGRVQPLIQRILEVRTLRFIASMLELPEADINDMVKEIVGSNHEKLSNVQALKQLLQAGQVAGGAVRGVQTPHQNQQRRGRVEVDSPRTARNRRNES